MGAIIGFESTLNLASPQKGGGYYRVGDLMEDLQHARDAGSQKGNIGAKILVRMMR